MFACFHDHIHVAVLLIAHGADHKMRNSEKKSAFQYVFDKDKLQLLTDLVTTGTYAWSNHCVLQSDIPEKNLSLSLFHTSRIGDDGSPINSDIQHRLAALFNPNQQLRKQQINNNNSLVFDVSSLGKVGGSPTANVSVSVGIRSPTCNPTRSPPVKSPSQIILSQSNIPVKTSVTRNSFSPPARPPTSSPPPSQRRSRSLLIQVTNTLTLTLT